MSKSKRKPPRAVMQGDYRYALDQNSSILQPGGKEEDGLLEFSCRQRCVLCEEEVPENLLLLNARGHSITGDITGLSFCQLVFCCPLPPPCPLPRFYPWPVESIGQPIIASAGLADVRGSRLGGNQ